MKKFGIGQPVRRIEDQRFLTGRGSFIANQTRDGEVRGVVLRCPHAHARVRAIDTTDAAGMPGVLAVFTGADYVAAGLGLIPCTAQIETTAGTLDVPPRHALAVDVARHVGDPVAFVVAETLPEALAASEAVVIEFDALDAIVETGTALSKDAPRVWPEHGSNEAFRFIKGDAAKVEAALKNSDHGIALDLVNNRVIPAAMEPRGVIATYDAGSGTFDVMASVQGVHGMRALLARHIFAVPAEKIRLAAPDVGGGFGAKNFLYPEMILTMWAARELGRPVKWIGERMENFVSDIHARDHVTHGELGVSKDGRITALRIETVANMGAYLSPFGPHIPTNAQMTVTGGIYDVPALVLDVRGVFTNTVPIDAYRGAGRPEANYVIERLVTKAAGLLGLDPVEIRKRNAIARFPHTTQFGMEVDCGGLADLIDRACLAADRDGFAERRKRSQAHGKLRGLGIASYLESTLGVPSELGTIRLHNGGVEISTGTHSTGQGHETAFTQLVHEWTGIAPEHITYVQADTARVASGAGHGGSRSLTIAGGALMSATETFKDKCRQAAAHLLEAAPGDIEIAGGDCVIAGTDRRIAIIDLADGLAASTNLPDDLDPTLATDANYTRGGISFPNGCHVAEVEVDPETGAVRLARFTAVDDFGRIVNPLLVAGQVHGGLAQGIGQALLELTAYDPASGQLVTGSFNDYALPHADDLPALDVELVEDYPTTFNPLGVKGTGEAGCTGSPAAIIHAILDALEPVGVRHIDMPATPLRVWRAIRAAQAENRR